MPATQRALLSPRARAWDIALIVLMLPVVLPVAVLVALAVFLDSPGPIIYHSRRIGADGAPFVMFKFRTMLSGAAGPALSARDDERYTPLGRTLARSRLDELPQLWNVVRGEMRLVGPRPEVEDFVRAFPEQYKRILQVPPGLTGPAQVEYAWEGEILARAQVVDRARVYRDSILPLKLEIDQQYASHHTAAGDLVLLARTALLPAVRAWRHAIASIGAEGEARAARIASATALLVCVVALVGLLAAEAAAPI